MSTPFDISDRLIDELARANPLMASFWGLEGDHGSWGNWFSPEGAEERLELARRYLAELGPHLDHPDREQRIAARAVASELESWVTNHELGAHYMELRHLGGPMTTIPNVFNLMRSGTLEADDDILRRLETVGEAFAGVRATADAGIEAGKVVARRQVESVMRQARHLAGDGSAFDDVAARIEETVDGSRLDAALASAKQAAAEFADWLESSYLPYAAGSDGVGADLYRHALADMGGKGIDPTEAYVWGWEELARLIAEMNRIGNEIVPGASWQEDRERDWIRPGAGRQAVRERLESDPAGLAHTTDTSLDFVRRVLDQAVSDLAGTHFEVSDEIRPLEEQLAQPGGAYGVYYTGPSE